MESDDDYESFSIPNDEPSPSPKHRRLKRLKKSTVDAVQSSTVESVNKVLDLPKVDFTRLEVPESSDAPPFDDSIKRPSEGFDGDGDGDGKELKSSFDDTIGGEDRKETKRSLQFEEGFDDDDDEKVKELSSCYDDTRVSNDWKETEEDLEFEEGFDDDATEKNLSSGVGDVPVRTVRKETKRALDFDDEDDVNENGVDQMVGNEGESVDVKIGEDGVKEADEDANMMNKKGKKKRLKSSSDDPKPKSSYSSKRREEKERRAHLEQLHVESQRLLRETRGVSFKPVPLVQKPISSILERMKQRKLEVSKKFPQSKPDDFCKEDDEHYVIDHSKSVENEVNDLSEDVKEEKVSNALNEDPELDDVGMDGPDVCEEQKDDVNACSSKDLDVESTPALRAPVDDTQELFGDTQTSDSKESENDESCEQDSSSQEEEMGPSLLTMKLKFDSAPDDICDEEENDKENVDPHAQNHSSSKGDPVQAFVDDEAEEEDDSDNDRMVFGDDEEDENEDDIGELNKMIATGYKERPIDLETRNELHQKWLEEKDAAGTDDLLRRLNVASKLREASLLDEEGEEDVERNDNDDDNDGDEDDVEMNDHDAEVDVDEDVEQPRVARKKIKKAKEMIAQMFNDKDDDLFLSDDEETEKILVRERLLNKNKEKGRLVSPIEDEDSREVFGLIKKQITVPDGRKKANTTSFLDTMLTGGNNNSSSKSSFLSRMSSHSVPVSSKQGGSGGVRSFIFGRDDSNSRNSISVSEDMSDTIKSEEMQPKKVTTKYKSSQSQGISSTQTTKLVSESSSSSFFEILKRSSVQANVHTRDHKIELSQSVFAAFKVPKKPFIEVGQRMNLTRSDILRLFLYL